MQWREWDLNPFLAFTGSYHNRKTISSILNTGGGTQSPCYKNKESYHNEWEMIQARRDVFQK
jgi:hypothetical protein